MQDRVVFRILFFMKRGDFMQKKKILFYANYFYPEMASTSQLLTELCTHLSKEFDITVICAVPCYTGKIEEKYKQKKYYYENLKDIKIIRVAVPEFDKTRKFSRIKHILIYFLRSIKVTFKVGRVNVVYTISQPPILGGILGYIGKKVTKGKLIYCIQDFNPEQIMAIKYSKNAALVKFLLKIDRFVCKRANLIITVGRDMQQTLINRFHGKKVPNNVVINNWIDENSVYPLDKNNENIIKFKKKYDLDQKFIIMYSGNVGLFYDLENLIRLFKKYRDCDDVVFAIIGEGAVKQQLIDYCAKYKMNNVRFIPYQDKSDLIYSLNAADIHLVTNAKGIKGISVPSKIYGCLATNVPIFGILEKGTEAWEIIRKSNCGILAETGNYDEIQLCLDKIIKDKQNFVKKYLTGREYLQNNFTRVKSIEKYRKEIQKIID